MATASRPLVLHTESSPGFGGQEIRILTEASWLQAHGWRVVIACQPESRLFAEATASGVPVRAVRMRYALDALGLVALWRLMAAEGVALVHTHSSVDSWLATLAARSRRRPVVRSRHVSIPIHRRGALIYRLADRIIASADAVKALVEQAGIPGERVVVIPAGVDTTRFHAGVNGRRVRDELGLRGPAVGLVANVRSSKGHRYFLDAVPDVLKAVPDARFVIVGDGVGLDEVRRRVSDLGLGDVVTLTGFRRDVPEVMAALDLVVLPSTKTEAISQVLQQAMAVGTPVVASTIGGSPEVIRHGETGLLVPPADAPALASAIVQALRDPARAQAMAAASQAFVRAHLTVDRMMERTVQVYEELLRPLPG